MLAWGGSHVVTYFMATPPLAHHKTINWDATRQPASESVVVHVLDYAQGYAAGQARAARLLFIAQKAPHDSPLRLAAWQQARKEAAATRDPSLYTRIMSINTVEGEDQAWVQRVERENRVTRGQLEAALNRAKSSSAKEISRLAVRELGQFFWECGDAANALKTLNTLKDFSSNPTHQLEGHMLLVEVALSTGNFGYIASYASKAEQMIAILKNIPANQPIAKAAALHVAVAWGIHDLDRGQYKSAAKHFCGVTTELKFDAVVTSHDVATYGALCGLASFSRAEMRDSMINNQSFKLALEDVPEIRALVDDFWFSRYLKFVQGIKAVRGVLALDVFLGPHVDALLAQAHSQALCQYVSPYSTVRLDKMAAAFGCDVAAIETEVSALVANGHVQARIDSQNGTLIAQNDDKRAATFAQALNVGRSFVRETRATLLRLEMLEAGLVYDVGKRKRSAAAAASAAAGGGGASSGGPRRAAGQDDMDVDGGEGDGDDADALRGDSVPDLFEEDA